MHQLLQPKTLVRACVASMVSTMACSPRLMLWEQAKMPVWFMAGAIFICCITLWGFVFAWHELYARRPLFTIGFGRRIWLLSTGLAIVWAVLLHFILDPVARRWMPEDYPADFHHWIAALLFSLGLSQLFLLFAPFAWVMRLGRNFRLAAVLTVLWGAVIMWLKARSLSPPLSPIFLAGLLAGKLITGSLLVWFYLRGGIGLVCWWVLLLECRHLVDLLAAH